MIRTTIGLAVATAALIGAGPAAAVAEPDPRAHGGSPPGYAGGSGRPSRPEPETRLTLSYLADTGYAAAVKLDCDPVGGGHPQGPRACATLDAAGGDPDRIPPESAYCVLLYAPIVAEVSGVWRGKAVRWRHRYGNACEMRRTTGVLFTF